MSKYAQVGINNEVINMIVCEDDVVSTISGTYIKCTDQTRDAVIGSKYDHSINKFIDPKPYPSWALNSDKIWEAPIAKPESGISDWDEENGVWVDLTPVEIELPTE
jgi:hypothetical protein